MARTCDRCEVKRHASHSIALRKYRTQTDELVVKRDLCEQHADEAFKFIAYGDPYAAEEDE